MKVCTVQVNFLEVQPTINLKDNLTWLWINSSLSRLKHEKIQIRALGQIGMYSLFRIGHVWGLRSFIAHVVSLLVPKGIDLFFLDHSPPKQILGR